VEHNLAAYRAAVDELLIELAGFSGPDGAHKVELTLARWTGTPELMAVLEATPYGAAGAVARMLAEVRGFRRGAHSPATDLAALVRLCLLSQIDAVWWGAAAAYETDDDVERDPGLVELEPLRRSGRLLFRYRVQPAGLAGRGARAVERRLWTDRTPPTAGLRSTRARPEVLAMLNHLAARFALLGPPDTPPLWLTSLIRSVGYQRHLRWLGYAATLPSAHCVGYAMDVEMRWFRRYGAHLALAEVLLDGQRDGQLNVIDDGQAWHVCLSPSAVAALRAAGRPERTEMPRR